MDYLGRIFATAVYILGLVMLWRADIILWFVIGIFIPLVPWFYVVYVAAQKLGLL